GLGLVGSWLTFRDARTVCRPSGVKRTAGTAFFFLAGGRATSPLVVSLIRVRSRTSVRTFPDQRCSSKDSRSFLILAGLSPFSPTGKSRVRTSKSRGERSGSSVIDGSSIICVPVADRTRPPPESYQAPLPVGKRHLRPARGPPGIPQQRLDARFRGPLEAGVPGSRLDDQSQRQRGLCDGKLC